LIVSKQTKLAYAVWQLLLGKEGRNFLTPGAGYPSFAIG